jgi:predicted dienelactone hydrolase
MSSKLRWLRSSTIAAISTLAIALPGRSAERIIFDYPPFGEFSVSIQDLDRFAKTGQITPDFAFYAKRATPEQLQQLRELLQQRAEFSPVYVSQFTYAPLTEKLLERIGELIQTESRDNGLKSLRSALILAAADKTEGLTVINVLRRFPGKQIHLDLTEGLTMVDNLSELLKRRDVMMGALRQITNAEAAEEPISRSTQLDLRQSGPIQWQRQPFEWLDQVRKRSVPGDLYLPQSPSAKLIPVIVISHGVAEDRTTFAYLAEHLASHGFAVVSLEHTGGDANRIRQYFSGLAPAPAATELLERPRDVAFLLDELQRQAQSNPALQPLNLQHVGVVGHSLGGYTALAVAGATIDFDRVKRACNPNRSLNLSTLLQCRANELKPDRYALQDPRIKAIFAINPLGSTMFGQTGISQIKVPVFLMGGSDDIFTPAVPEQIYPFTWLQTPDKYLAVLEKGTHFSTEAISTGPQVIPVPASLIGPSPAIAKTYAKALSIAFFQTHLADRQEFRPYLNAAYANSINQAPMPLNLVSASTSDEISRILETASSRWIDHKAIK